MVLFSDEEKFSKFLTCFNCVSKSWLSLISDHNFAKSHFQLNAATRRILLTSLNYDSASSILLPPRSTDVKIKGSFRGFLCLYYSSNIYLWNPSTGVHKQILKHPIFSMEYFRKYSTQDRNLFENGSKWIFKLCAKMDISVRTLKNI